MEAAGGGGGGVEGGGGGGGAVGNGGVAGGGGGGGEDTVGGRGILPLGPGSPVGKGGAGGERGGGGGRGGARGGLARRASLGNQPTQERWVCPNDRHLALRAKLKMGWSTSQPVPVTRQDSLSEAETKVILDVIKRAEELEMNEQLRIGRLVDRVETMKGRVQGNGSSNCILCGESLPVLRTSCHTCGDCSKRVCSKCGVDAISPAGEKMWLCKICAETREVWKRSGAWFFRGLPKYILPTTSHSAPGSTTTSKRRAPPRRAHTLGVKAGGGDGDDHHHHHLEEENQRRLRKMASECVSGGGDRDTPPPHTPHTPHTPHSATSPHPSPHPRSRSVSPSPFRFDSQDSAGGRDSSDDHASDKSPVSPAFEAPQRRKKERKKRVKLCSATSEDNY